MQENLGQTSVKNNANVRSLTALRLSEFLKEIRPQLPIQNPMPFFVHNNPIQYWEKSRFDHGLSAAVLLYERAGIQIDRRFIREYEDLIIPIIAAYLDQGMRRWTSHEHLTENGLWVWFISYVKWTSSAKNPLFAKIKKDFNRWSQKKSEELICDILEQRFGEITGEKTEWQFYLKSLLFHLKGWSGIIHLFETNPSLYPLEEKKVSLVDWLAILVLIESKMSGTASESIEIDRNLRQQRELEIVQQIEDIKAKERALYSTVIKDFQNHINQKRDSVQSKHAPIAQVFFCIDDREEPLRRMLEKVNPQVETFGTVGFFGIDVAIKAHDQLIFQPFCPPVIKPRKKAVEIQLNSSSTAEKTKNIVSTLNHTRFTTIEPLLAFFAPVFYFASLALRTLNLELYSKVKRSLGGNTSKAYGLRYDFLPDQSYSLAEKAKIVKDILKSAGLKKNFSSVVVMMAHGATTTNNPFQKSYGCGACSGQSGFPNAKIFCSFANSTEVRELLAKEDYIIPEDTAFVAAHHDTCADEILISEFFGLSQSQKDIISQLKVDFKSALSSHTQDRFRRFSIPEGESASHRALDWSQPRPEYGHSKVAFAVFGPRLLTEGFSLSGRSFLVSYDPEKDINGCELEFVILNALPVCANINLDYFTSRAFPEAFGSGSKLPLNIVSGVGLMTGSKGDLRIGLARQMVDQHEPLRLLAFVFGTHEHLERIIKNSARLINLIKNEWIHLIRIDPTDYSMHPMTQEIAPLIPPQKGAKHLEK